MPALGCRASALRRDKCGDWRVKRHQGPHLRSQGQAQTAYYGPETLLRMRLKVPRTAGNVDLRVGRRRQIDNVTNLDAFETSSAAEEEALDAVCAAIEYRDGRRGCSAAEE
jgi:hypothetical protein